MVTRGTPPAADEIEISLFGPGYGEAILLHVGNGDWIAVDSCSRQKKCVPLAYLELLGIQVHSAVKAILVSHWHDDHISGLFQLYERAKAAELYYPAAFQSEVFQIFSQAYMEGDAFTSETSEIGQTFRLARVHNREAVPTLFDKPILPPGGLCEAVALSPSSAAFSRFIASVARLIPSAKRRRQRLGSLTHNDAAIVLQVKTPAGLVLLGSDLEEDPHGGWSTILGKTKTFRTPSNVFKVAHHGSKNGHHQPLWKRHLTSSSLAILTVLPRQASTSAQE